MIGAACVRHFRHLHCCRRGSAAKQPVTGIADTAMEGGHDSVPVADWGIPIRCQVGVLLLSNKTGKSACLLCKKYACLLQPATFKGIECRLQWVAVNNGIACLQGILPMTVLWQSQAKLAALPSEYNICPSDVACKERNSP